MLENPAYLPQYYVTDDDMYLINTLNGFDRYGERVCWQVTQLLQRDSQTGFILFLGLNTQAIKGSYVFIGN